MKNKNKSQRLLFFFDFFNSLKQMKIDLLNPKTLLKLAFKTLKKIKILALKILIQNNQEMGYLYPHFKSARWQLKRANLPFRSTGRSTERAILPFQAANGQISYGAINTPI